MKLAMSVGTNAHYRIDEISGRHFAQTGDAAGFPKPAMAALLENIASVAAGALDQVQAKLPSDFPESIVLSVSTALKARLDLLVKS